MKIKVLQATLSDDSGGLTSYILQNYKHIDKKSFEFGFICSDDRIQKKLLKEKTFILGSPLRFIKYYKELKKVQKKENYDIIHFNMSYGNFIPVIIARLIGFKRIIVHAHSSGIREHNLSGLMKRCINFMGRFILPKIYSRFFACSDYAKNYFIGERNCDFFYARNAIEIQRFRYDDSTRKIIRKELAINDKEVVIGHIGRFDFPKNQIFLLKLLKYLIARNQNYKLVMVGDGKDINYIKKKTMEMGLKKNIIFLGNRNDVEKIYQSFDIFILPSVYEGFPIVGVEAQAIGIPCLFSDNITSEVKINDNVDFVSLDAPMEDWEQRIQRLISGNRPTENKVAQHFDITKQILNIEREYLELMKEKK